jgi:hypothetical protein
MASGLKHDLLKLPIAARLRRETTLPISTNKERSAFGNKWEARLSNHDYQAKKE